MRRQAKKKSLYTHTSHNEKANNENKQYTDEENNVLISPLDGMQYGYNYRRVYLLEHCIELYPVIFGLEREGSMCKAISACI